MEFLQVSEIWKQEGSGQVLKDISFVQPKGRHIAIAGETGSGKSTLLKVIGGLAQPDGGVVYFEGKRVLGPLERLIPGQPGIAYLSQHFELRNSYRVEEILSYANQLPGGEAEKLFVLCQIDHLLKRRTDRLSGGERQRIALARLLVSSPRLLLLDEPFSNLDIIHKETLKRVIDDISARLDITCILVSHDPADLLPWADELLILKDGTIQQHGTPQEVYGRPVNAYVAGMLGKFNLLSPEILAHFPNLRVPRTPDTGVFLRPEQLLIHPTGGINTRAVIRDVAFLGNTCELLLDLHGHELIALTVMHNLERGDTVSLSIAPGETWLMHD